MIYTFNNLPESTLTDHLDILEAVCYLISINYSIIAFFIIKAVIN